MSLKSSWGLEWRLAAIRNGIKETMAYRGDFLLDVIGSSVVPVGIQLMLWHSILQGDPNARFAGMSSSELLSYTWTSMLFSQIRGGNHDFTLIELIRTGSLSNYLLRPVGVVEFTYFKGIGEKLITATLCLILGSIATLFTSMQLSHLFMGLALALMGNIIAYLFGAILAGVAFYWENAFAVLMVKNMVVSLFSGELIPLSIVPEAYSYIWKATPFYLFVYGPTQVAMGKWDTSMWGTQMGIAVIWIFALWGVLHATWKFSIHRYQGIGG